jgi:hypothetical protein
MSVFGSSTSRVTVRATGQFASKVEPDHILFDMWPPSNIQALPSKDDIQQIKQDISSMEQQIVDAQLKIETLRKSVAERKAWIAPIRKLPHDVLSQIFVEVSMDEWKAPLTLQGVCRWWRDVVVGSPRAWTFIPLSRCDYEGLFELVSLFIERGRHATLHLFSGGRGFRPKLKILAHRIECLSLDIQHNPAPFVPGGYDFTRLERLELLGWHAEFEGLFGESKPDMMCFPHLKCLELQGSDPLIRAIAASPGFPSIRHLKVRCGDPSPLTDILMKCAQSVESINLTWNQPSSSSSNPTQTIHFPFLRYIRLGDKMRIRGSPWYFEGSTPNLEAYLDQGGWSTIDTFKFDTSNVIFLQVLRAPNLSRFPRLVTIRMLGLFLEIMKAVDFLRAHPRCSPDLALIEHHERISDIGLVKAKAALLAHAQETGVQVRLGWARWAECAKKEAHWIWEPVRPR